MFGFRVLQKDARCDRVSARVQHNEVPVCKNWPSFCAKRDQRVGSHDDFGDVLERERDGDAHGVGLRGVVKVEGLVKSHVVFALLRNH
jgi:hypothetical protein